MLWGRDLFITLILLLYNACTHSNITFYPLRVFTLTDLLTSFHFCFPRRDLFCSPVNLEPSRLLPRSLECWDYDHVPSHLDQFEREINTFKALHFHATAVQLLFWTRVLMFLGMYDMTVEQSHSWWSLCIFSPSGQIFFFPSFLWPLSWT